MFFRRNTDTQPTIQQIIEDNLNYTITPASRSASGDFDKINLALQASGIPVMIERFVPGIMYQYYMKPKHMKDYQKLLKQHIPFSVAFGSPNVRLYIDGSYVVLEVPGADDSTVCIADILRNEEYYNAHNLKVAIGQKTNRENVLADIEKMPHMLIAGTTGSGKSVFMHQIILSLLINHSKKDLQLYLIDPKMVEMPLYSPLRNCKVVSSAEDAIELLDNLCIEMDRRYAQLGKAKCRDIDSYNQTSRVPMSRIVIFIDELADLILQARKKVEKSIVRLAQKARACGIHLVVATQRPDRTVVTGLIKTNIPVKVCLSVNTDIDSRIVLDRGGAEKLRGKGDMLYLGDGMIEPIRLQGGYVSENGIKNIVNALSKMR